MAEPGGNGGGEPGGGGEKSSFGFLARKVGPLPVWAWAGLIVGGYYLWQARKSPATPAPAAVPAAQNGQGQPYQISQYAAAPKQISYSQPTTVTQTATPAPVPAHVPKPPAPKPKPKPKPRAHKRAPTPRSKHSPVTPRRPPTPVRKPVPKPVAKPPPKPAPAPRPAPRPAAATQAATVTGPPGPLVSTVQQADIVTAPAYLDTSGAYQREAAGVPTLVYPVVPSAPGQPPVSPPTEANPPVTQAYAPQTAGDIYATAGA